jgi:phage repressor protein C with HTH and peptisase S24 domain
MDEVRGLVSRIIEERGLSLSAVSKQIGRSHSYLQQFLKREIPKELPERVRSKLADVLGLEETQLGGPAKRPENGGTEARFIYVDEFDVRASMGPGSLVESEAVVGQWPFPSPYVRHTLNLNGNSLSVIEVRGDSMEPTLRSGDKIMIDHDDCAVAQPGVFALYDGNATVVKRVEKIVGSDPPQLMLISDNPAHGRYPVLSEQVHVAGRVVWFGRRL